MKKNVSRLLSLALICIMLGSICCVGASSLLVGDVFSVKVTAGEPRIHVLGTTQMTATITVPEGSEATDEDFTVVWSVDASRIASIDEKGVLKGISAGEVKVTATVTDKEENTVSDTASVYVVAGSNPAYDLLSDHTILGYKYSYDGDYFYTNNDNCWQSKYGFLNAFDIVCP